MYMFMCVCIHVCMDVCIYVCIYVYMYACMHEHDIGMCSLHMQIAQVFCRCEERMRTAQEEWEGKGGNKGGGRKGGK